MGRCSLHAFSGGACCVHRIPDRARLAVLGLAAPTRQVGIGTFEHITAKPIFNGSELFTDYRSGRAIRGHYPTACANQKDRITQTL
jgi:hypothetical protein